MEPKQGKQAHGEVNGANSIRAPFGRVAASLKKKNKKKRIIIIKTKCEKNNKTNKV